MSHVTPTWQLGASTSEGRGLGPVLDVMHNNNTPPLIYTFQSFNGCMEEQLPLSMSGVLLKTVVGGSPPSPACLPGHCLSLPFRSRSVNEAQWTTVEKPWRLTHCFQWGIQLCGKNFRSSSRTVSDREQKHSSSGTLFNRKCDLVVTKIPFLLTHCF